MYFPRFMSYLTFKYLTWVEKFMRWVVIVHKICFEVPVFYTKNVAKIEKTRFLSLILNFLGQDHTKVSTNLITSMFKVHFKLLSQIPNPGLWPLWPFLRVAKLQKLRFQSEIFSSALASTLIF